MIRKIPTLLYVVLYVSASLKNFKLFLNSFFLTCKNRWLLYSCSLVEISNIAVAIESYFCTK